MKFWKKSKTFVQNLFFKMDTEELQPMDLLANVTEELQERYRAAGDISAQAQVFQDFLRRWETDTALDVLKKLNFEIKKDLDWFNVSQCLTLESLKGKVVILDFFTYCCINCMHILPELNALEKLYPIERGLVVVGVHSPKFENEKDASNILAAAQRYGIQHPIVNDPQMSLWRAIGIRCWPTLMVLAPSGAPLLMLMGEGHALFLERFVEQSLRFFAQKEELMCFSLPLQLSLKLLPASKLRFPAKIARSDEGNFAVADAGNHRILIFNANGDVLQKIGSSAAGLADGDLTNARFNSPQGVTFLNNHTLIVADTENHAIRQINLRNKLVETLAGTGQQGHDRVGGKRGPLQQISSPWDVVAYGARGMEATLDERVPVIIISMAGTHQIWGYFPEGSWWKSKKYEALTCVSMIGSGREENRNNAYPQNAAFAQPSGLTLVEDFLFIADSESSSIRKASLVDGKVSAVVGGDPNPQNLFAFGDIDGKKYAAKLQHPLGVAYNHINGKVYIADTYNHKLKAIDIETNTIETLAIKQHNDDTTLQHFNEPAGLCLDATGKYMLVSNTNNHEILRVDLETLKAEPFLLRFKQDNNNEETVTDGPLRTGLELIKSCSFKHCRQLKLQVSILLDDQLKFTADAPQKWSLNSANSAFKSLNTKGCITDGRFSLHLQRLDEFKSDVPIEYIKFDLSLSLCDAKSCLMKRFSLILKDDISSGENNSASDECKVNVRITPGEIKLS